MLSKIVEIDLDLKHSTIFSMKFSSTNIKVWSLRLK